MINITKAINLAWRKHLLSEAGSSGIMYLRERMPAITKGDSHNIIFDAGVVEGYRRCLDDVERLAAVDSEKAENIENP